MAGWQPLLYWVSILDFSFQGPLRNWVSLKCVIISLMNCFDLDYLHMFDLIKICV